MGDLFKRKCPNCGKEFETDCKTKVYCSGECNRSYYRKSRKSFTYHCKCELCGKEFVANNPNKKCCSKECSCKLISIKKTKKKTSRKATPESMAKEYERMKKNGVPVKARRVEGMGVVVESRGQHCWSGGPSIARLVY